MDEEQATAIKQGARATWASGDFDEVANYIWSVGPVLVGHVGPSAGQDVLDIGAGSGNAAVAAAATGAAVTASDLTPELFVAGRRRAEEAGVELEWVEADAEALPFEDSSFDIALSTFGIMFAPRHDVAASEALRVLRPGGRFGFASWEPRGNIGEFFATVAAHMPPPPEGVVPPPMWGDEDHVRGLFEPRGVKLEFVHEVVEMRFDSAAEAVTMYEEKFGPTIKAKEALEPEGKWDALRQDLIDLFNSKAEADGGKVIYPGEYLIAIGTKPG